MHLSVGEVKGTNWEKSADVGTKLGERALKLYPVILLVKMDPDEH